jgi:ABC-type phosphate/phosphonate transport system substrate-binding protein
MKRHVASLGMYDHPAQHAANDGLWEEIARTLVARGLKGVPACLDRARPVHELWHDPDLLFGQACGYPLTEGSGLPLRVVAQPIYSATGADDGRHASVLITRAGASVSLGDYRGLRAAINDRSSNTGMNLFRGAIAPHAGGHAFFADVVVTGSHRESARALLLNMADLAAIDAVTWAALESFEPELTRSLQVIGHTAYSPTLPFVTAAHTDIATVAALRLALEQVMADPGLAAARAALFLTGIAPATPQAFAIVQEYRHDAERVGYPALA